MSIVGKSYPEMVIPSDERLALHDALDQGVREWWHAQEAKGVSVHELAGTLRTWANVTALYYGNGEWIGGGERARRGETVKPV